MVILSGCSIQLHLAGCDIREIKKGNPTHLELPFIDCLRITVLQVLSDCFFQDYDTH